MEDVTLKLAKNSLDKLYLYIADKYIGLLILGDGQAITFVRHGFESTWESFESLIIHLKGEL